MSDNADINTTLGRIKEAYRTLLGEFGSQEWWPGDGPFEVMVGAVLTQGTSWKNVELALARLKEAGLLNETALASAEPDLVRELVRPAGFQRRKHATVQRLAVTAARRPGGLGVMLSLGPGELRELLLSIHGVGRETADAIMLYAAQHPVFVVDAYTRRFAERHRLVSPGASYERISELFSEAMGGDVHDMQEMHALVVRLGKLYCRPAARCDGCPLRADLQGPCGRHAEHHS